MRIFKESKRLLRLVSSWVAPISADPGFWPPAELLLPELTPADPTRAVRPPELPEPVEFETSSFARPTGILWT